MPTDPTDPDLADFIDECGWRSTTLTNARLERVTGRTTTWRDLEVVRAVDERWGT